MRELKIGRNADKFATSWMFPESFTSHLFAVCYSYACPKGTIYQDVFIYIKCYVSMSRLDYTYQDLHTRKTRFQYA